MDFVRDTLRDGRAFRALMIVDDFTREYPVIEVDTSLTGKRVTRVFDQLAATRGPRCRRNARAWFVLTRPSP